MKMLYRTYVKIPFVMKMTAGFLLGIAAGLIFGGDAAILKPLGTVLLKLLQFIAVPVVFTTVILAVDAMNPLQVGRVGGKLLLYYMATTACAVFIGTSLALMFRPGTGLTIPHADVEKPDIPSLSDVLLGMIPDNAIAPFVHGDLLPIMFISILVGIALASMRNSSDLLLVKYGNAIQGSLEAANKLFFIMLKGIMQYAPIGVFAIAASVFGLQGYETFASLLGFAGIFYLGVVILWAVVYVAFLMANKVSVPQFFKQTKEAYVSAFFTSSSIAALPVSIEAARKAGVSDKIANFSIPLGAAFNSDGGALRMGLSIVFAANISGVTIGTAELLLIIATGTLLSVGTAGVPAAGLVTLSIVLSLFGLPLEIVALIAGVDAIIGMAGTASNVMGDIVGAAVVDASEKRKQLKSA